ncbi:MAG TPA: putative Ig domain-containing protein, partial [Methanosarcina sp.]
HNTYGPGIWLVNYDTTSATGDLGKNVHIHHNIFYNTGTNPSITWVGGIVASGFHDTLIENNVFDGTYHAAVVHMWLNENPPNYSSKTGYTTIVRNNIIINTQKRTLSPSGTGYGVINYLTNKNHKFVLQNNCLYNNAAGNYKNCASKTDIYVNPLFADQKNHDYHLKSTAGRWNGKTWVKDKVSSPCIDAGYPSSAYSSEPKPNGNRINVGRYGNTIYASLSSASKVKTVQPPLTGSITEVTNETNENLSFTKESFDTNESNFTYSESDTSIDVGQGPVIEAIPEAMVKTGENLSFIVKASSGNGKNFTFSASELPAGANFDETGLFSWVPSNGQEGLYTVSFEVSDGMFSDSEVVIINVVEVKAPLNHSSVVEEKVSLNLSSVLDEEVPLNLSSKIYNSGLYEVSPAELSLNNLFSYWGK